MEEDQGRILRKRGRIERYDDYIYYDYDVLSGGEEEEEVFEDDAADPDFNPDVVDPKFNPNAADPDFNPDPNLDPNPNPNHVSFLYDVFQKQVMPQYSTVVGLIMPSSDDMKRSLLELKKSLTQPKAISDLQLTYKCFEVVQMDLDHVLVKLKTILMELTTLASDPDHRIVISMPSRKKSNQRYIMELDRFVLGDEVCERILCHSKSTDWSTAVFVRVVFILSNNCMKGWYMTKRQLFYTDKSLFKKQEVSDSVLHELCCILGCTRSSLNIFAAEKGLVGGLLKFTEEGMTTDCSKGLNGKNIPIHLDLVESYEISESQFILVVEKHSTFAQLMRKKFYNKIPCIIICGKGQGDVSTRLFLNRLQMKFGLPVLGLMDGDLYGLLILLVYRCGSRSMSYDSGHLATPCIKWLGIRPSDIKQFKIPESCKLEMSDRELKMATKLLHEEFITSKPRWADELKMMISTRQKVEIEALSFYGMDFLTEIFLPYKIGKSDWV